MVGGHDGEQLHEFLEQVHHAHVTVFRLHNSFAGCRDRSVGRQGLDQHLNTGPAAVHASFFVGVDEGRQQGLVAVFGCFFEERADFPLFNVSAHNGLKFRRQTFQKSALKPIRQFRTWVKHFFDARFGKTLTADHQRKPVKRRRNEPFPIVFGLVSLQAQRVPASFHSVSSMNGSGHDESVDVPRHPAAFHPRPNLFFIEVGHFTSSAQSCNHHVHALQHQIGAHPFHLSSEQFVIAQNVRTLHEVLGFVVRHQHPRWFLSRQEPSDGQAFHVVPLPVKGAHGHQIARTVPEGLQCRFHVRELLEQQITMLPVRAHRLLDLKPDAVVARWRGKNDETLTRFHRFTSVRVAPHIARALTTG